MNEQIIVTPVQEHLPKYRYQCWSFEIITEAWLCGPAEKDQDGNDFAGAFPAGFLKRVKDALYHYYPNNPKDILHVCSGRVPKNEGMRLDIDPKYNPDFLCNAEEMTMIEDNRFKFEISDTPYNTEAALKYYNKPMLNRAKVLKEMARTTVPDGLIGILDQVMPVSPPRNLKRVGMIGVTSVPNLDMRIFTILKKDLE